MSIETQYEDTLTQVISKLTVLGSEKGKSTLLALNNTTTNIAVI